jgi:hypothetical protein
MKNLALYSVNGKNAAALLLQVTNNPCDHPVTQIKSVTHARSVILTGKPSTG